MTETTIPAEAGVNRRGVMNGMKAGALGAAFLAAMGPVGAALVNPAHAQAAALDDATILNFALNLEYLEAQFYLRAVTGQGLAASDTTGVGGAPGIVNGGARVNFTTPLYAQIAANITIDEQNHVRFLRSALGSAAAAQPTIDLAGGFQGAASAAGLIGPAMPVFNPFADETSFLLGAFIFEDVGVTAYAGAAALISNKAYLSAAASILAVEAYHGGSIRTLLNMIGGEVPFITQAIANLRSKASGTVDDLGIVFPQNGNAAIAPLDGNSLAYRRTVPQVINLVTNGNAATGKGGFFPAGLNLGAG